jgi:hypothetical protein
MKLRDKPHQAWHARPFPLREPLLAIAIAAPLLLGCRSDRKQPDRPAQTAYEPAPELPHYIPSGPAYKGVPAHDAGPNGAPAALPAQAPAQAPSAAPSPQLTSDYSELSAIISGRVAQESSKMKLTPEEGRLAESYLRSDLPRMPSASALAGRMPKTAIELVRAVHERGVSRDDAEAIAAYLARMLDSMQMGKIDKFDECCSHVLGRRWSQIDYSGESLDAQKQERFYLSKGIPDLLTAEHVRGYFRVETQMPYFRRIFNPQGPLPEF